MDIRGLFLNQAAKQGVTCYQSNMHSLGYSSFYSETILSQKFLQASKPMKVEQMHVFNIRMTNIYANEWVCASVVPFSSYIYISVYLLWRNIMHLK